MLALTLFLIYFCFASLLIRKPNAPKLVAANFPEFDNNDYWFAETDILDALTDMPDDAEIANEMLGRFQGLTVSDEATEADGYVWESFEGFSLTGLRKVAKTHGVPRYTRLDRAELVFEINTRRKAETV